jgi:predicted nucleic acid-binding protein
VVAQSFEIILPNAHDFDLCRDYLLRFETGLRVGDAMHLAIAGNHQARAFYSLDKKLLKAGRLLGLPMDAGIRGETR